MILESYAFLLVSCVIGLLCLHAAGVAARVARRPDARPERRRHGILAALVMGVLGVMEIVAGLVEVVIYRGQAVRPLDWFWLVADMLLPLFFLMMIRASLARDDLQARLAAAAEHDPLTGLPNRAGFAARALALLAQCERAGRPVSLAMFDIDRFKLINDGWGHAAGDAALQGVARAVRDSMRTADVIARFGGEEFILLMLNVRPPEALILVERIRKAVTGGVPHPGGPDRQVTLSAGIALVEGDGFAAIEAVIKLADAALYRAKEAGRDRVMIAA